MGIMTKKTAQQSGMNVLRTLHVDGVPLYRVQVSDKYHHPKYWVERQIITKFTDFMEWYLRRHPEIDSHSERNLARSLIYMQPGIRAWSEYMPGGFATYHVHSPHERHMHNGRKVDIMTRALFRHSSDALGLRSRAAIMAYIAEETVKLQEGPVEWLSIASGSGQPTYDACRRLRLKDQRRVTLTLADISSEIMEFAEQLYAAEGLTLGGVKYVLCNVVKEKERRELLKDMEPAVIDIMGLFEYLSDEQCIKVLRSFYLALAPGGSVIFTNMSPGHPHLHVHQRGLGWPGVIQRTIREVVALSEAAGIPKSSQSVYRAEDNVYNIFRVEKK
jgi:hypothetical protein